jgi:hypothetical protein
LGSALLEPSNAITELGSFLIILAVDGLEQLFAELDQLGLRLLSLGQAARRLARVFRGIAVDTFQERQELLTELFVVVRAAKPAAITELDELDATVGTFSVRQTRVLARLFARTGLHGRLIAWRLIEILVGALLTQMEFVKLLFADHFGDVQSGGLGTLVALHRRNS